MGPVEPLDFNGGITWRALRNVYQEPNRLSMGRSAGHRRTHARASHAGGEANSAIITDSADSLAIPSLCSPEPPPPPEHPKAVVVGLSRPLPVQPPGEIEDSSVPPPPRGRRRMNAAGDFRPCSFQHRIPSHVPGQPHRRRLFEPRSERPVPQRRD